MTTPFAIKEKIERFSLAKSIISSLHLVTFNFILLLTVKLWMSFTRFCKALTSSEPTVSVTLQPSTNFRRSGQLSRRSLTGLSTVPRGTPPLMVFHSDEQLPISTSCFHPVRKLAIQLIMAGCTSISDNLHKVMIDMVQTFGKVYQEN